MYVTKSVMLIPPFSRSIIMATSNPACSPAVTSFLIGSYRQLPGAMCFAHPRGTCSEKPQLVFTNRKHGRPTIQTNQKCWEHHDEWFVKTSESWEVNAHFRGKLSHVLGLARCAGQSHLRTRRLSYWSQLSNVHCHSRVCGPSHGDR